MAGKKRISFTLADDDYVSPELRENFSHIAKNCGIPVGILLSRAFYMVCEEHYGEVLARVESPMDDTLDEIRQNPQDIRKPLKEEMVADTEAWSNFVKKCRLEKREREWLERQQRKLERN